MPDADFSAKSATVKIGKKTYKVTSIATQAFFGYDKLSKVVIGKNVKKIASGAFSDCKKLKTITVTLKKLTKKSTKDCLEDSFVKTVKAPKDKVKAYRKIFAKSNSGSKSSVSVKQK